MQDDVPQVLGFNFQVKNERHILFILIAVFAK